VSRLEASRQLGDLVVQGVLIRQGERRGARSKLDLLILKFSAWAAWKPAGNSETWWYRACWSATWLLKR